jgi:PKD repeat protein
MRSTDERRLICLKLCRRLMSQILVTFLALCTILATQAWAEIFQGNGTSRTQHTWSVDVPSSGRYTLWIENGTRGPHRQAACAGLPTLAEQRECLWENLNEKIDQDFSRVRDADIFLNASTRRLQNPRAPRGRSVTQSFGRIAIPLELAAGPQSFRLDLLGYTTSQLDLSLRPAPPLPNSPETADPFARPEANFVVNRLTARVGQNFSLNARESLSPFGSDLAFTWELGDGRTLSGEAVQFSYATAGTYTVQLITSDLTTQVKSERSLDLQVLPALEPGIPSLNPAPKPVLTYVIDPQNPLKAHFDATQSTDDGSIVSSRFRIENAWYSGPQRSHTFSKPGVHTVRLEVTDDLGKKASRDTLVQVADLSQLVADELLFGPENFYGSLTENETRHQRSIASRAGLARLRVTHADGQAQAAQDCGPIAWPAKIACLYDNLVNSTYISLYRLSSAQVFLNGQRVVDNLGKTTLSRESIVLLTGQDQLEVRTRGWPTAFVTVELQSLEVNLAPQANFNLQVPPKGIPALILIDASASTDPNDQVTAYRLEIQPDNIVRDFQASPHFAVSVPSAGTKLITITVRDQFGLTASLTQDLTIFENLPPVVIANWVQLTPGAPFRIQVQADAFDPDDPRENLVYNFSFADGFSTGFTPSAQVTRDLGQALSTSVNVEVRDPVGLTTSMVVPIQTQANLLPIASFTIQPRNGLAPATLAFDASASSDPDGHTNQLIYRWNFGDGETGIGRNITHTFQNPGEYTVRLTVTDEKRGVGVQNRIVFTWSSAPPTPRLSATPLSGTAPLLVSFNVSASTPGDTPIVRYVLITGDGATLESATPHFQHTYQNVGTYNATLKVYDQDGDGNLLGQVIQVLPPQLLAQDPRCESRTPAAEEL